MGFIPRWGITVFSYLPLLASHFEKIALGVSRKCNINGTCTDIGNNVSENCILKC